MEELLLLLFIGTLFILEKEPIYSILYFVFLQLIMVSNIAMIDIFNSFIFFSYILIIVYLSALIILFSFVIFLSPSNSKVELDSSHKAIPLIFYFIPIAFICFSIYQIVGYDWESERIQKISHSFTMFENHDIVYTLGKHMYQWSNYIFQLFMITFLLLLALVGSLLILS